MMTTGERFRMTVKTRLFLFLNKRFEEVSQWFINHCDMEPIEKLPQWYGPSKSQGDEKEAKA